MFSITQNLIIEAKKLVILNVNQKLEKVIEDFLHTCYFCFDSNKYIKSVLDFQKNLFEIVKSVFSNIASIIDKQFSSSPKRLESYIINKSNVSRTIVTIFGSITFQRNYYESKDKKEKLFYVDKVLGLSNYQRYDPIIKALIIQSALITNANKVASLPTAINTPILDMLKSSQVNTVPRQTIYRWIKDWKLPNVSYNPIEVPNKKLYVMVDEKFIHEQIHEEQSDEEKEKHHFIMSKCFVTFTGIKQKGKRKTLLGKHIFITNSKNPWVEFSNDISQIYDFELIEKINILSDAGTWILAGTGELKLFPKNVIVFNTCEFHVKQKINRITRDKEKRMLLTNLIYEDKDKASFSKEVNQLIKEKPDRKEKLEEYKSYILKHWSSILNMKECQYKSSMESHISHCIAEQFGSRPKAYSKNNISNYLKLHEYLLNEINILDLYLKSYNNSEYQYNEKELDFSLFDNSNSNLPALYSGKNFLKFFT